jgi:hypothetical protein
MIFPNILNIRAKSKIPTIIHACHNSDLDNIGNCWRLTNRVSPNTAMLKNNNVLQTYESTKYLSIAKMTLE